MASVDQLDLKPTAFQNFKDRNPVYAGGLHGHRGDAAGHEPVRQAFKIVGERRKLSHRWLVNPFRNGDEMASGADVDPGSRDIEMPQMLGKPTRLLLGRRLALLHQENLRNKIGRTGRGAVGYGSLLNGIAIASPVTRAPAPGPC